MPSPDLIGDGEVEDVQEVAAVADPRDLSDAFAILRESHKDMAQGNLEDGKETGEPAADDAPGEPDDGGGAPVDDEEADVPDAGLDYDDADYRRVGQNILNSVKQQARSAATETFKKNGIRKFTIADLYEKDEQRGVVSFRNPDDPSRPFQSRADAMGWIDSMNQAIDTEYQNLVRQNEQRFAKDAAPAARLMQFAPTYNAMDEDARAVLDDLIEPYGIMQNPPLRSLSLQCPLSRRPWTCRAEAASRLSTSRRSLALWTRP